ncbi:MAG: hypothetical protein ACE37F_12595 [Nannocystaceae bacterium]|nr:hypothetical protein [bacterium]
MTTTTTLIVQGHAYAYKATVNDEVVVEDAFEPDEAGVHVHPLSSILLEGENVIRVGGTPSDPGAQIHIVLGTQQVGSQPRALLENTFSESFGVSTSLELGAGDGLPRAAALGADPQHAKGPVMDLHQAVANGDVATITTLLAPVAQFWSTRDETEPSWDHSDYYRHLRSVMSDPGYRLRPLKSLEFASAAGGRLIVPLQGKTSALTFEHRDHSEASVQFQVALAPSPTGWVFLR